MAKYYMYSQATAKRLQKMGIPELCYKCQTPIQIGEYYVPIHRYTNNKSSRTKIYHQKCYENLYIDR
ncbi:MAG: hypothetical protein FWC74_09985 [Candidatus Bathyarchaeota archaeon]|nr:hypothetical protein [Candidatus Termitimicrobium sp.]